MRRLNSPDEAPLRAPRCAARGLQLQAIEHRLVNGNHWFSLLDVTEPGLEVAGWPADVLRAAARSDAVCVCTITSPPVSFLLQPYLAGR